VNWKELQRIGQFGTSWLVNHLHKKKTQEEEEEVLNDSAASLKQSISDNKIIYLLQCNQRLKWYKTIIQQDNYTTLHNTKQHELHYCHCHSLKTHAYAGRHVHGNNNTTTTNNTHILIIQTITILGLI